MEEKDILLSAAEASKILNISRSSLSRLVRAGRISAYRIGHKTLFDRQILDQFKASVLSPAHQIVGMPGAAGGGYSAGGQQSGG